MKVPMAQSEKTEQLNAALFAAQAEFKPVVKGKTNPHFGTKYADLEDIKTATGEALRKHSLQIKSTASVISTASGATALRVITRLTHLVSKEFEEEILDMPLPANYTSQSMGSANTYGRRYGRTNLLDLVTEDDDDGNAASGRAAQSGRPAPVKTKPAPKNGEPTSGAVKTDVAKTPVDAALPSGAEKKEIAESLSELATKLAKAGLKDVPGYPVSQQLVSFANSLSTRDDHKLTTKEWRQFLETTLTANPVTLIVSIQNHIKTLEKEAQ
jgi:hypothetical protein